MKETIKTRTKPLVAKNYFYTSNQLNLTRLVDDAVDALGTIRNCGVGRQRGRSRYVISRSFRAVLCMAGYTETQARTLWQDQVVAIDSLNANAEQ